MFVGLEYTSTSPVFGSMERSRKWTCPSFQELDTSGHFSSCPDFQHIIGLHNLPDTINDMTPAPRAPRKDGDVETHSRGSLFLEALKNNSRVLATASDWLTLAYLEPLLAKKHGATINHGEKQMRTLNLF